MYSMLENFHNFSLPNVSTLATRHFTHRVYLNILCDSNSRDHILKFLQPQKISPLNESAVPFSAIGLVCGKVNNISQYYCCCYCCCSYLFLGSWQQLFIQGTDQSVFLYSLSKHENKFISCPGIVILIHILNTGR